MTSGGSPAGSSGAFDAAYAAAGILGETGGGLGTGAKNIGIGAWDAAKGTLAAAWAFTGGTAVDLFEGNQTIYGAIGNSAYNLATSADARANTWNSISSYATETFTDTDKFSQRIGGNGLITLLTLGAGEAAQGLRVGGAAAEGGIQTLEANLIRFSQSNVRSSLPDIVASMKANGWQGAPIDVVRMADGGLTAVDNTRLLAAHLTDTPVQAITRDFGQAFPVARGPQYFGGAQTWGEAVLNRIGDQKPLWQSLYPSGSPFTGIHPATPGFTP